MSELDIEAEWEKLIRRASEVAWQMRATQKELGLEHVPFVIEVDRGAVDTITLRFKHTVHISDD